MKKICIVSFCNFYILPYAKTYIDSFAKNNAECVLLFWDRDAVDGANDNYPNCTKKCFTYGFNNESNRFDKLKGYIGAARFFNRELKKTNYDGVVFLQTHAAVACYSVLKKKYLKKYIVDIRDWTLENYAIYRSIENRCIRDAYSTVISSPAYKKFLPEGKYIVAHNYTPFDEDIVRKLRDNCCLGSEKKPLSISFVGTVRFFGMDKNIVDLFANDDRFQINYYGTGSNAIKEYCERNNITNVDFHGGFSPEMTSDFYMKTDMINNLYGNHNKYLDYALSNKLYHAAQFYIPIIVCPQTYMEEVTREYRLGFVLDVENKNDKECLYEWFHTVDINAFKSGCDNFLQKVREDNTAFYNLIDDFSKC